MEITSFLLANQGFAVMMMKQETRSQKEAATAFLKSECVQEGKC